MSPGFGPRAQMKGARSLPDCWAPDSLWVEGTVVQSQFKSKTQVSSLLRLLVSLMVTDELFPLFASPQMFHGCHCLWAYKNMILICLVDSHSWNPLSLLVTFRWCDWYIWTNGKLNGKTTHFPSLIMNLSHHCFTQKKIWAMSSGYLNDATWALWYFMRHAVYLFLHFFFHFK